MLATDLLKWFDKNKRNLPWRKASKAKAYLRDPYRVWVSEIMLQQTQVKTVIPYFNRWLKAFPNLKAFANADLDDVLKLWEGLGYYRRARNLHKAAQIVVKEHNSKMPTSAEELSKLPGIGSYTSAAIASLAYGEDILAVDGNIKRVASRLFCIAGEITEKEVKAHLEAHLPKGKAGAFNESLMELGATICTPKNVGCESCPLQKYCQAFQKNVVADFPSPKIKKKVPHKIRFGLVYLKKDKVFLQQRDDSGMLAGLWGFPLHEKETAGLMLPEVKHAYTHFKITVTPILTKTKPKGAGELISLNKIETLALSTLDHKILDELKKAIEYD